MTNQQLKEKYNQELEKIVEVLKKNYNPQKIILFGSLARGELHKGSDIDMLIIKDSKKKRYYRVLEVLEMVKEIKRNFPFGPLIITPKEFEKGFQENRYFIRQIAKDGKILYEA